MFIVNAVNARLLFWFWRKTAEFAGQHRVSRARAEEKPFAEGGGVGMSFTRGWGKAFPRFAPWQNTSQTWGWGGG